MSKKSKNIELRIATVSSRGLILEDKIYTHPMMIKHGWFESAGIYGEWQIPVLYNHANTSQVVLFDTGSAELFIASTIEHSEVDTTFLENYFNSLNEMKNRISSQNKNESYGSEGGGEHA